MKVTKITPGFQSDTIDSETGHLYDSEFIAADDAECQYEDENGEPVDWRESDVETTPDPAPRASM